MQRNIEALPSCTLFDVFLWLMGRRSRLRIVGNSMLPTLKPGDEVFIDPRGYRNTLPQAGDIVTLYHPHQPALKIVKRVDRVVPELGLFLRGDRPPESTDSRHFGWIAPADILGKVMCRFDVR